MQNLEIYLKEHSSVSGADKAFEQGKKFKWGLKWIKNGKTYPNVPQSISIYITWGKKASEKKDIYFLCQQILFLRFTKKLKRTKKPIAHNLC